MQRKSLLLAAALLLGAAGVDAGNEAAPDPLALALPCAGCHATDGGSPGAAPKLAGMDPARFVTAMRDFQTGSKPATVMNRIARGYSDAELAAMADFFHAGQSPTSNLRPPRAHLEQAQPGPENEPRGGDEQPHSGRIFPENRP